MSDTIWHNLEHLEFLCYKDYKRLKLGLEIVKQANHPNRHLKCSANSGQLSEGFPEMQGGEHLHHTDTWGSSVNPHISLLWQLQRQTDLVVTMHVAHISTSFPGASLWGSSIDWSGMSLRLREDDLWPSPRFGAVGILMEGQGVESGNL